MRRLALLAFVLVLLAGCAGTGSGSAQGGDHGDVAECDGGVCPLTR
jgi:hypothetical protein